jgi:multiple sugar transport system permease protein
VFFGASVLSVTIVTIIWKIMYLPGIGLISHVLALFGIAPIPFLTSSSLALPAVAVTTIWWIIGLPMMLFLAALQQIPGEIYEAAALDNSGRWRTLWSITLPSITRTLVVVVIYEIVAQFQLFGQALLLTRGGPNNTSRPIVLFIYETGFRDWNLGYAAAASEILFLLMAIAAMAQYVASRRKEA